MAIKQLTIFVENKQGTMASVTGILAAPLAAEGGTHEVGGIVSEAAVTAFIMILSFR